MEPVTALKAAFMVMAAAILALLDADVQDGLTEWILLVSAGGALGVAWHKFFKPILRLVQRMATGLDRLDDALALLQRQAEHLERIEKRVGALEAPSEP